MVAPTYPSSCPLADPGVLSDFHDLIAQKAKEILKRMPRELALPVIASLYPDSATEKAYICSLKGNKRPQAPLPPSKKVKVTQKPKGLLAGLGD